MLQSWMLMATLVCLFFNQLFAQPRTIVFTRIGGYQIGLFVSRADGSDERPLLTSDSVDYNSVWSPDGKWIVFTSERNGSADLYRVKLDGTGLERLTDNPAYDDQAAFSPDGQQIVFVSTRASGTADLWILDLGTRKARPLTHGGGNFRPAWSPDGKWIAFTSDRGSPIQRDGGGQWWVHLQIADIYLIRPDGSGLKRITNDGNFCGGPKWTADNRHLIGYCMSAEETFKFRSPPNLSDQMAQAGRAPLRGDTRLVFNRCRHAQKNRGCCRPRSQNISIRSQGWRHSVYTEEGRGRARPLLQQDRKDGASRSGAGAVMVARRRERYINHRVLSMEVPAWKKDLEPEPGLRVSNNRRPSSIRSLR